MTTPVLDATATVRDLLFGAVPGEPIDYLAEALRKDKTIKALRIPAGLTAVVEHEVATKTEGLLTTSLSDLAIAGWKSYGALVDAAHRTGNDPRGEEIVALVTHKIESRHRPNIELFINEHSTATFHIELQITFTVAAALAVVRQARLTEVRSGTCTVNGSMSIQQNVLATRQRHFDLRGAIRSRHGIPLLESVDESRPQSMSVPSE